MSDPLEIWRALRPSGTPVPLVLGTMNFGKRTLEDEARRIVDRALDEGVTFFDTANAYVDGEGEILLGRLLGPKRKGVIVSTKVGLKRIGGARSGLLQTGGRSEGLSRARIISACDESLARLKTDYIDVYFLHVPDPETPIDESLSAMAELLRAGKVRSFATSNYASWQMLEMITWCDRESVPRPLGTQQIYNLLVRQLEIEYFAFARKYALPTTVYNPLAGGLLSGLQRKDSVRPGSRFDDNPMYERRYWSTKMFEAVEVYAELARSAGLSLIELSYAWLASRPEVDSIALGPSSLDHFESALSATRLALDPEVASSVDQIHRTFQGTDARYARLG